MVRPKLDSGQACGTTWGSFTLISSNPVVEYLSLIVVTSTGYLGQDLQNPLAASRLKMEIEVDSNYPPVKPQRITDWVEEGKAPTTLPPAPF